MNSQPKDLPWHIVEAAILRESAWFLEMFDFGPWSDEQTGYSGTPLSQDAMLRQISVSIVRGKIRAREINNTKPNGLWTDNQNDWKLEKRQERHGGEWHRTMMALVKNHFLEEGFDVINEPLLHHGRADLGVYKDGSENIFVEIGTTSLFKTWVNLHAMPNTTFLFVPTIHYALEFKTWLCTPPTNTPRRRTTSSIR